MKKFFALLTALVLCATLFTGIAVAEDENLASAKGLLDFWFKNKSRDKLTQTAEDYEVPAQLMIDGVAYPLTWSVDTDTIQITPAEDGKYLVDVDEANPKDLVYTLTATVTAPDGSTLDVPYERMVPAAVLDMSYADIVAAAYALDTDAAMTKAQRSEGRCFQHRHRVERRVSEHHRDHRVRRQGRAAHSVLPSDRRGREGSGRGR